MGVVVVIGLCLLFVVAVVMAFSAPRAVPASRFARPVVGDSGTGVGHVGFPQWQVAAPENPISTPC